MTAQASLFFFATCPRGLEALLASEVEQLGGGKVKPVDGGVEFRGDWPLCYRVNLESRLADRVLWRVYQGHYRDENSIYHTAKKLDWPKWFSHQETIKIRISGRRSPLKSLNFAALKVKDAVCDSFRAATGARPSVDIKSPDVTIHVFLDGQNIYLYLDTSGMPLFMRGMRKVKVEAPLRENLAAGILQLAGWTPDKALLDPMCGGGTFLQEAVMAALNIAPGLGRDFAFETFRHFQAEAWQKLVDEAEARCEPVRELPIYGSDRDAKALAAARRNLESVGFLDAVHLSQSDILEVEPPAAEGILVANPPYGVRLEEQEWLAKLYPQLGDRFKQHFAGWQIYLLTSDMRLPKLIRLRPKRKTPLFNGALECRLYAFDVVKGSHRGKAG